MNLIFMLLLLEGEVPPSAQRLYLWADYCSNDVRGDTSLYASNRAALSATLNAGNML
ncbi:MAG: hypothetical protein WC966_03740 [Bradymonadales bacterium]